MLVKKNNNNSVSVYVMNDSSSPKKKYDINEICETADSIYWTLVPKEVFRLWKTPYTVKQGGMDDTILYDFTNLWE